MRIQWKQCQTLFFGAPKSLQMVTVAMKLKDGFVSLFSSVVFLDYISPFNICCKAGLVVLNSLNFCLSEKLISPSVLNEILAGYCNLGYRLFLYSTLNIFCHCFLAYRVSAERSAVKCIAFPLYVQFSSVQSLSRVRLFVTP